MDEVFTLDIVSPGDVCPKCFSLLEIVMVMINCKQDLLSSKPV